MNEKISIIMSTCNTPKQYLDEAINSVLRQTYSNFEFIIICDGVVEEYQYITNNYRDERIKILLNKQNRGLPFSLNRGISESSGKYIARMDSDDICFSNRLEKELKYLKKTKIDLCGSAVRVFGDRFGGKKLIFTSREDIKIQLLFMATLMHPTVIGKSEVFKKNKYNEKFVCAQDFELWSRLEQACSIGYCNKALLKYRMHSKQATTAKGNIQREMARRIISKNAGKISGEYDERVFNCLWLLGGREKITKSNYQEFSHLVDYVLKLNDKYNKYNKRAMRKIFYNRYCELILKYKVFAHDYPSVKKILHFYNLRDLLSFSFNTLLGKVYKRVMIKGEGEPK